MNGWIAGWGMYIMSYLYEGLIGWMDGHDCGFFLFGGIWMDEGVDGIHDLHDFMWCGVINERANGEGKVEGKVELMRHICGRSLI